MIMILVIEFLFFKIGDDNDIGYELRESKIKLPGSDNRIIITGDGRRDQVLVNGYLRELFQSKEFSESDMNEPSMDIIKLIQTFFVSELLHCFSYDNEENVHLAIPLACIL